MLSAFQLENNRLTRLEADEIKHLASSVWVDLVEPDDDERSRVQTELGQNGDAPGAGGHRSVSAFL